MGVIAYNATDYDCTYIYTTTGGGTVFSANLATSTAFDLFSDTAVVNDAIYFSRSTPSFSDIKINIGTAMAGTGITLVWQHYSNGWKTIPRLDDETVSFTTTGTNTVKFPIPPVSQYSVSVNGVNTYWVRCRISALTTISEGGATTTDKVKTHNGLVTVTGYLVGAPCTFTNIYNYLNTNYPEVGAIKNGKSFCFNHCVFTVSSYLASTDETVYFGNGGYLSYDFNYVQLGTRISDYYGIHGSTLMFSHSGESGLFLRGYNAFYASQIGTYTYAETGYGSSYLQLYPTFVGGTYIQTTFDAGAGMHFHYTASGVVIRNSNLVSEGNNTGGIWSVPPTTFDRSYIVLNSRSANFYNFTGTFTNAEFYKSYAGAYFHWRQLGYQNSGLINLVNPVSSLGTQGSTSATAIISKTSGGLASYSKVFFYDDSTTTYTDYTTAASDDTENDVPLNGDIGDILYFKVHAYFGGAYQYSPYFTISSQANDYVYAYEYYKSAVGWTAIPNTWDMTSNFTQSGFLYIGLWNLGTVIINGTSGSWIRLRITTKGTGTPTANKIQESDQTGAFPWHIYEKYTFNLKVQDTAGIGISGATVSMVNNAGTSQFSVTTDANGLIAQQTLTSLDHHFDPLTFTTQYQGIGETDYSPFTITISKSGYETRTVKYTMDRKREEVETLDTRIFTQGINDEEEISEELLIKKGYSLSLSDFVNIEEEITKFLPVREHLEENIVIQEQLVKAIKI